MRAVRRLHSFTSISLDGYFADAAGDMSWAHSQDPEWSAFVAGNAGSGGMLVFGRKTYEMMVKFWPTPAAMQMMPEVAAGMNGMPKVVFSRTLRKAEWNNTTVLSGDPAREMRALKASAGPDMVILGSGSIVTQLAVAGLIDEFQVVTIPLGLGQGQALFGGASRRLAMTLQSSRAFRNGHVLNSYAPRPQG